MWGIPCARVRDYLSLTRMWTPQHSWYAFVAHGCNDDPVARQYPPQRRRIEQVEAVHLDDKWIECEDSSRSQTCRPPAETTADLHEGNRREAGERDIEISYSKDLMNEDTERLEQLKVGCFEKEECGRVQIERFTIQLHM